MEGREEEERKSVWGVTKVNGEEEERKKRERDTWSECDI